MTPRTRWLPVPGYENRYLVSTHGEVRTLGSRTSSARVLRQAPTGQKAYPGVTLYDGFGGRRTYPVHVLVLLAFHGPRPDGYVGRHRDGVVTNNHYRNLVWGTQGANMQDAVEHGTIRHGEAHYRATLSYEDALSVKSRTDVSVRDLARIYDISVRTAYSIRRGETWKYLP